MAEIKSTLDLVMEKTRHLTLSREEKEENRRRELAGRLRGLLQQLEDGLLGVEALTSKIDGLLQNGDEEARSLLCRHLMAHVNAEKENGPWIRLLTQYCRADAVRLEKAVQEVRRQLDAAVTERRRQLLDELASQGVSGSAVRPNLDRDAVLDEKRRRLSRHLSDMLAQMVPLS